MLLQESGGAIYARSQVSVNFAVTTIVGPGFIALAAMIFGEMEPNRGHASLELLKVWLLSGINLLCLKDPSIYLQIAPYVLTMVVLAAFFGQKTVAPSRWCCLY